MMYFLPFQGRGLFLFILTMVAQFELELHQMDVKSIFLNGNLEAACMEQLEGFKDVSGQYCLVCKL